MIRGRLEKRKSFPRVLGILVFLVLLGGALWHFNPLAVRSVKIEGNTLSCMNGFSTAELGLKGQNILFINKGALKNKILDKYPCVADISLKTIGIGKMGVTFLPRVPLAYVASISVSPIILPDLTEATPSSTAATMKLADWSFSTVEADKSLVIDKKGWVFKETAPSPFPQLFIAGENIKIGPSMDGKIMENVGTVLSKLPESGFPVTGLKLKIENDGLFVDSAPKLIFSVKKDILRQLISLQLILQKAKIDEKVVETIDLRFDKPVIIYTTAKRHG